MSGPRAPGRKSSAMRPHVIEAWVCGLAGGFAALAPVPLVHDPKRSALGPRHQRNALLKYKAARVTCGKTEVPR